MEWDEQPAPRTPAQVVEVVGYDFLEEEEDPRRALTALREHWLGQFFDLRAPPPWEEPDPREAEAIAAYSSRFDREAAGPFLETLAAWCAEDLLEDPWPLSHY